MRTNTDKFQSVHGHKPRGNGLWFFEITATDGGGAFLTETHNGRGTMAKARAMAIRAMKDGCGAIKSIVEVEVLP